MKNTTTLIMILAMYLAAGYCAVQMVSALPTGATVTFNATAGTPSPVPDSRADPRGTITTLILNAVQQDQSWKAYVGNVTGRLSLDDASGNTIYDWSLSSVNKSGQVFVTRNSSVNFVNLSCINATNMQSEHTFFGMSSAATDNVNNTFNYTSHAAISMPGGTSINANTCRSTATYILDVAQTIDGTQRFQELALQDNTQIIVYTSIFSANTAGYDNRSYDFQLLVPENTIGAATTYYFYTQLSG